VIDVQQIATVDAHLTTGSLQERVSVTDCEEIINFP
jgi:hypothetical protein